ncbi:MAG: RdgB/HAM1 family non-canonical purine NTP pyrophosphatase [Chitinophagales bacterium]|nr:RdgB/HAM1 family non-canonical purine NTP pyrophosphatase [Chitinophagales bacterium]MDW8273403.1 RdgB/HAM1 family non-canonical purine NTP pyrophosphatase [Chitinophagales bacterium]
MEIIFATTNKHKIEEIQYLCPGFIRLKSLHDLGFYEALPETCDTIKDNALQKATYIFERYHQPVFAEDTGLEVEALGGAPGVFTARYAGDGASSQQNISKLLHVMKDIKERKARFVTYIAFVNATGESFLFEGICNGEITESPIGSEGFGYDPVFKPHNSQKTFAQMSMDEKNIFSHRRKAFSSFLDFLILQHKLS